VSFYFSQLLATTGVRVGPPALQPQTPAPSRRDSAAAPEIVDVVDEVDTTGSAQAISPPPAAISTTIIEKVAPSPSPHDVLPASRPPSPLESPAPQSVTEKFPPEHTGESPNQPARPSVEPHAEIEPPSRETHAVPVDLVRQQEQQPSSDRAQERETASRTHDEMLDALMKWIAAAEKPRDATGPAAPSPEPPRVSMAEGRPTPPARPPAASAKAPASRMIGQEVSITEARPSNKQRREPLDVPSRAVRPSEEQTRAQLPSVSIGAIHLRIEAPAAPAPPPPSALARSSPAPARPAPSSRSAGLLKLRRHYLLPH